jgi:hypothetical protein
VKLGLAQINNVFLAHEKYSLKVNNNKVNYFLLESFFFPYFSFFLGGIIWVYFLGLFFELLFN